MFLLFRASHKRSQRGNHSLMRPWIAWALWFAAFFWTWMLMVGDWNRIEWIAGACVAATAASIAEPIRRASGVQLGVPFDVVRAAPLAFAMVFVDFGILVFALLESLVARRVVRGQYVTRRFDPRPKTTPGGEARRACRDRFASAPRASSDGPSPSSVPATPASSATTLLWIAAGTGVLGAVWALTLT